jgi:hypothetical protein
MARTVFFLHVTYRENRSPDGVGNDEKVIVIAEVTNP